MLTTDCRFQSWAQSTGTTWSALPRYYPPYICSVFMQKVNIFVQNCPGPTSTRNIKWAADVFASGSSPPSLRCGAVWYIVSLYLDLSNYATKFLWKATSASTWTQLWQIAILVLTAGTPLSTWRLSTRTARLFSGQYGWIWLVEHTLTLIDKTSPGDVVNRIRYICFIFQGEWCEHQTDPFEQEEVWW